ncbi:hypothetical protein [Providencia vermicola]|uniref:hypothetical protein n=1 Tax=Providencia vermicola TaxID=333965 RepID=UPI0034E5C3A4
MKIIKQVTLFFLFMGLTYSVNANSIIESLSFCDHRFFDKVKHDSQLDTLPQNITLSQLFSDSGLTIPLQYTTEEGIELTRFVAIRLTSSVTTKFRIIKLMKPFIIGGLKHRYLNRRSFNVYPPRSHSLREVSFMSLIQ